MLKLSGSLMNQPVVSLQSSSKIATAAMPIIDPDKLAIVGWHCREGAAEMILLTEDVREINTSGLVVNDHSSLSIPAELVRHQEVLSLKFELLGKLVKSKREKLGKVSDFAYDDTWFIQQLYVEPPILKIFGNHETRIIGRGQIKEITHTYILVGDAEVDAAEPVVEASESEAPLPEVA